MTDDVGLKPYITMLEQLFAAGRKDPSAWPAYAEKNVELLEKLSKKTILTWSEEDKDQLAKFIEMLVAAFLQENFIIPENLTARFIKKNVTLSNLAYFSKFSDMDPVIVMLSKQKNSLAKILILYSRRSRLDIPLDIFFTANPGLAYLWWCVIISEASSSNEVSHVQLTRLLQYSNLAKFATLRLDLLDDLNYVRPFFYSSYVTESADRFIKPVINRKIKELLMPAAIQFAQSKLKPDMNKICIVSELFMKRHAVYKSLAPLIYPLKKNYHLTLLGTRRMDAERVDHDLFDDVMFMDDGSDRSKPFSDMLNTMHSKRFGTILYPDIGITQIPVFMGNLRISPIQMAFYGHPVSTCGAEIDYFIGDARSELVQKAAENYSETLILLPKGALPILPSISRPDIEKAVARDNEILAGKPLTIVLNWGSGKFFWPHLKIIRDVLAETQIEFNLILPSIRRKAGEMQVLSKEIQEVFSNTKLKMLNVLPSEEYQPYMQTLAASDLAFDSYPFGGYNRIIDLVHMGVPTICREGERISNRLASFLIREVGLSELVATSENDFAEKMKKLVNDRERIVHLRRALLSFDTQKLCENPEPDALLATLNYLIKHHKKIQSNRPAYIEYETIKTNQNTR